MINHQPFQLQRLNTREVIDFVDPPWRQGGEASIYRLGDEAAKVYHQPPVGAAVQRIHYFVENQPRAISNGFVARAWAWPTDALIDPATGSIRGAVSPLLSDSCPLGVLFDQDARDRVFPGLTTKHLPCIAANMMEVVEATHQLGLIHGDISPGNLLVSPLGGVSVVDLESAQIITAHEEFRCSVGTPDYLAPEIANLPDYSAIVRDWRHDSFSLGAVSYQLLTGGVHCCDGGAKVPKGEWPPIDRAGRISIGAWHASTKSRKSVRIRPPANAIDYAAFGPELGSLYRRCFDDGYDDPSFRPRPTEWRDALQRFTNALRPCTRNRRHYVHNTLGDCPWCEVADRTTVDPFPVL